MRSEKMYIDMKPYYWWVTMKIDIVTNIGKSLTCSLVKTKHQRPYEDLEPLKVLELKWNKIIMNFMTKLSKTKRDHGLMQIIVYHLAKYSLLFLIKKS